MRVSARARGGLLLAVLAMGAAAGSAGCNFIVGVGDYTVFDAGSFSLADSAAGDAASNDGGMTESAGPAVCGQGLPTSADFQQLVKTCLLTISCDPYFFQENISGCITHDYLESSSSFGCLKNLTSCTDFNNCWGEENATLADCPNTGAAASCDANNRAINCNDRASGAVRNCAKLGGTCATYTDPNNHQMAADCLVNPTCSETDGADHCLGNSDYICVGGQGFGQNCSSINATCTNVNGSGGCFFANPGCSTPGYSCTNSGATLAWCSDANQAFDLGCARGGLSCAVDQDSGTGYCLAPGCDISAATSCSESCGTDGKTINVCVGGAPLAIDCTQYGFTKCAQASDMSTTPATVYAYCQK
jgi:hypothetical protein